MEYHAGLVEQKEYEKTEAASMEIEETKIMEEKTVKEPDTEEMEVQALFEAPWDIEKQGTEYHVFRDKKFNRETVKRWSRSHGGLPMGRKVMQP